MDLTYFKRFRMEIDLAGRDLTPTPVPSNYDFLPWEESLLDAFSQAKYRSFRNELDANVFPCLAEFDGCRKLMAEIVRKPGFLPEATWLVVCSGRWTKPARLLRHRAGNPRPAGTGGHPEPGHRSRTPQRSAWARACCGARWPASIEAGVRRVYLEVTAQNEGAIRLYRRVGFVAIRTVYKAVEAEYST